MARSVATARSRRGTSSDASAKRAAATLARAIKQRQKELREERESASARRKRQINLQLRQLDKANSCVRMLGYGTMCALNK
jgi:hypothetical protein